MWSLNAVGYLFLTCVSAKLINNNATSSTAKLIMSRKAQQSLLVVPSNRQTLSNRLTLI